MTEEGTSYHHLYYSAHADPAQELEKLNQGQPCIKLASSPSKDATATPTATFPDSQFCVEKTATLARNGHQRSTSTSRLLLPTTSTTNTSSLTGSPTRLVVSKDKSCCSCCCLISVFSCVLLGFLGGLSMGILAYRAGYGGHLESFFPFKAGSGSLSSVISPQAGREGGRVRCRLRMTGEEGRSIMQTCTECLNTRLVNVSNAWYADCNGLYTITNLSSVWDPKRLVYQRIKGGINPEDNREGVSNHPWLGSWSDKVEVSLSQCGDLGTNIRFDKQRMTELKQKNQEKPSVRVNYRRGNQTDENE